MNTPISTAIHFHSFSFFLHRNSFFSCSFHLNTRSFMFISNAHSLICRLLIWCAKPHFHLSFFLFPLIICTFWMSINMRLVCAVPKKVRRRFGFIYINHKFSSHISIYICIISLLYDVATTWLLNCHKCVICFMFSILVRIWYDLRLKV